MTKTCRLNGMQMVAPRTWRIVCQNFICALHHTHYDFVYRCCVVPARRQPQSGGCRGRSPASCAGAPLLCGVNPKRSCSELCNRLVVKTHAEFFLDLWTGIQLIIDSSHRLNVLKESIRSHFLDSREWCLLIVSEVIKHQSAWLCTWFWQNATSMLDLNNQSLKIALVQWSKKILNWNKMICCLGEYWAYLQHLIKYVWYQNAISQWSGKSVSLFHILQCYTINHTIITWHLSEKISQKLSSNYFFRYRQIFSIVLYCEMLTGKQYSSWYRY